MVRVLRFLSGVAVMACLSVAAVPGLGDDGKLSLSYTGETQARLPAMIPQEDWVTLGEVNIRWRFGILMEEPVMEFVGGYHLPGFFFLTRANLTRATICTDHGTMPGLEPHNIGDKDLPEDLWRDALRRVELLPHSRFRLRIANNFALPRGHIYLDFEADSLVRGKIDPDALSVPASPSWDRLFRYTREEPAEGDPWLDAATAKALFAGGIKVQEIRLLQPRFDLSALRTAFDRHMSDTCSPGRAPQQQAAAPVVQDAAIDADALPGDDVALANTAPSTSTAADSATANTDAANSAVAGKTLDMSVLGGGTAAAASKLAATPSGATDATGFDILSQPSIGGAAASVLLLIDASGSMGGNKLYEAKRAAQAAVKRAAATRGTEIAVASFSGYCGDNNVDLLPFTTDVSAAESFIDNIEARGGTPMSEAVGRVNRYMENAKSPGSRAQLIVLLADGADDCGGVGPEIEALRRDGALFRHETIGLDVATGSNAEIQLQELAELSGGGYQQAASAADLARTFEEVISRVRILDLFGGFGKPQDQQPAGQEGASGVNWGILGGGSQ